MRFASNIFYNSLQKDNLSFLVTAIGNFTPSHCGAYSKCQHIDLTKDFSQQENISEIELPKARPNLIIRKPIKEPSFNLTSK